MTKIVLQFLMITSLCVSVSAQEQKFGYPVLPELLMDEYPDDADANAVILSDRGETTFREGYQRLEISFIRTVKIKILKKSGLDRADIELRFYHDGYGQTEWIKDIKGFTHNVDENGTITTTPLDPEKKFEVKINQYWSKITFAMPDVRVGSVIEYQYDHRTPFMFNLPDWSFQNDLPTVRSEYKVTMVPFYEYVYLINGNQYSLVRDSKTTSNRRVYAGVEFKEFVHYFEMSNIPAFNDESFITTRDDYISKIDFQLARVHSPTGGTTEIVSTWPLLSKKLTKEDNFGKYIKSCQSYAGKLHPDVVSHKGNELDRIKSILEFIKSNLAWNGFYSKYATENPKKVFEAKKGSIADINLSLIAFLRAADFNAYPVLISTRDNGRPPKEYPLLGSFNYVAVLVKLDTGETMLLDATRKELPFDRIPPTCLNGRGFVVNEKMDEEWVPLINSNLSISRSDMRLAFSSNADSVSYEVKEEWSGYSGYGRRLRYRSNMEKAASDYQEDGTIRFTEFKDENYSAVEDPYQLMFKADQMTEKIEDNLFISPFMNLPLKENPLKQETRTYPVDMTYPTSDIYSSVIEIPAGYEVKSLPRPLRVQGDIAQIIYVASQLENTLKVEAVLTFKKSIYDPNEYDVLKRAFDIVVNKFNEKIVLEKSAD